MAESRWMIGKYNIGGEVWKKSSVWGQVPNALGIQASHAAHGWESAL